MRLDKRLRPLDYLPNEVLVVIFELVQSDWERLPSPFQLCHVSRRWRDIANSTQSLWRDLRILRIETKVPIEDCKLSSKKIRKPYVYSSDDIIPQGYCIHPKDCNHTRLIEHCARQSHDTLTVFELEILQTDLDPAEDVFKVVSKSAATLTSIFIANNGQSGDFAGIAWRFALQCPRLVELELSLGRLCADERTDIERSVKDLQPLGPTLRTLKLDGINCFNMPPAAKFAELLKSRCSDLETLRLLDDQEAAVAPNGIDLVAGAAESLIELEISVVAPDLFFGLVEKGIHALPKLRRLRHISTPRDRDLEFNRQTVALPALESFEGSLSIVRERKPLPACVVLRVDSENRCRVEEIASWIRDSINDQQLDAVEYLTIELLDLHPEDLRRFNTVVDALTPGVMGKVICPRLVRLSVLVRDQLVKGGELNALTIGSTPQRTPLLREEWEDKLDVSRIVRMEALRRRVSQGLPVEKTQRQLTDFSSVFKRGSRAVAAAATSATEEARAPRSQSPAFSAPRCAALQCITLEGCYVEEAAWEAMKKATMQCRYDVTPDPDLMIRLPFEGPKRKKAKLGERRVHAW